MTTQATTDRLLRDRGLRLKEGRRVGGCCGERDPKVVLPLAGTAERSDLGDIGAAIEAVALPHGIGVVRDHVGHSIGRQMHEAPSLPNYGRQGKGLRIETGMAFALEPMFNLGTEESVVLDDGWTVVTGDGAYSAPFEHTVLVTDEGSLVSTLPEPRLV